MTKARRYVQPTSLKDRLAAFVKKTREMARELPHGPEREALQKKARQADIEAQINDWAYSPGLQPPTSRA